MLDGCYSVALTTSVHRQTDMKTPAKALKTTSVLVPS